MSERIHLSIDNRGRVSVQKLGFDPSSVLVAEPMPDGSVVLRQGHVLTDAEVDFLRSDSAREALEKGLIDLDDGRVEPGRRSR